MLTGMFPTFCTANEAAQVANAEACIKLQPDTMAIDIVARRESPAPVISTGFTVNAGKCCLLI